MLSELNGLIGGGDGLQYLVLMLIRISVVIALAWLGHFAWRHANPQLRVLLWRTTALGLLVVFALNLLAYDWNLPVLPPASTNAKALSFHETTAGRKDATRANALGAVPRPVVGRAVDTPRAEIDERGPFQRQATERRSTEAHIEPHSVKPHQQESTALARDLAADSGISSLPEFGLFGSIIALWLAGVAAISITWLLGVFKLVYLYRRSTPVVADIDGEAAAIAAKLGYSSPLEIRHSNEIQSPCNVGAWRPRVLIPSRQCEPSERQEMRASLAHELAHCMRNDLRWNHLLTLLQALLWFHPLAWRMRLAHTDACDEVCDAMAARYLGDQELYGRLLAGIALRIANQQPMSALAMARRSQVRLRIEAIGRNIMRNDLGRWTIGSLVTCGVTAVALVGTVTPTRSEAGDLSNDDDFSHIQELHDTAEGIQDSVRTALIRFRKTRVSGPFHPETTQEACAAALAKYDLCSHPEDLRALLNELLDVSQLSGERRGRLSQKPWSDIELHYVNKGSGDVRIRETRHRLNGAPDVHVIDRDVSVRWDDANSQMNIDSRQNNRYGYTRLSDFWQPIQTPEKLRERGAAVEEVDNRVIVKMSSPEGSWFGTADAETGFLLNSDHKTPSRSRRNSWRGWREWSSGIAFPRVVMTFDFTDKQLTTVDISIVEDAHFNAPFSDTVFRLGIPAGSVVVDSRASERRRAVRVNRDVFDAVSWQEVDDALEPIEVPLTQTEKDAIARLKSTYVLADGELVKRFGPPYPLERKYLPRLLQPKEYYARRRGPRYDVLQWKDGEIVDTFVHTGAAPSVSHLIGRLTGHPITDVEIPDDILNRRVPGDYLYRPDAGPKAMADALAEILANEMGRPVRLVFDDVERTVYIASSTLTINESIVRQREDRPLIMVNGGDHAGDHGESIGFGDLARFVDEVSEYINVKVINKTEPDSTELSWSTRWYDLKSTPPEKRFDLKPAKVLDLIERQTGIQFIEQKKVVRVLRLEQ